MARLPACGVGWGDARSGARSDAWGGAVAGERVHEALFGGDDGPRLQSVRDGLSFTIMIVESAKPVPWTKPEDLPFDNEKPLPELGGLFEDGFHVAFADGGVLFLSKNLDPIVLRAAIMSNGGEILSSDAFRR